MAAPLDAARSLRKHPTYTFATVATLADAPDGLDGRRGAAEDQCRARLHGELDRHIRGLDPWRPIALVGALVLLVDDDQANVG